MVGLLLQACGRRPWWAWTLAAAAVTLLVWPGGGGPLSSPLVLLWILTTVTLAAAGLLLAGWPAQRRNGALLLSQALVYALNSLDSLQTGPWQYLAALVESIPVLLLAVLLLRWPGQRLQTRAERWALRYAWVAMTVVPVLVSLTWDPAWKGYHGAAWWPTLWRVRPVWVWFGRVNDVDFLLLLVVFLALVGARVRRATARERRILIPVVVSAVALAAASVPRLVGYLGGRFPPDAVVVLENVAILAVPVSVLVATAVRRVQRALAVEALLQPARLPDPESIRIALARALGDRDLVLALWSPDRGHYVSPDGVPTDAAPRGRLAVDVPGADGSPVARVLVDARLGESRELVDRVLQAASVALDNARLQADLRASQREAAESSTRLSAARDTERSLARLLPGGLVDRLHADPDLFSRTERLTVTVLMSDIRGYSGIAETTAPADLARQLDEHRRAMNSVILREGGTVMQYVGDAVLAVFGAPDPLAGHQEHALRAAADMHRAQGELDARWSVHGLPPFGLGIGVSTGEVAAGFLGSEERAEYTVVGDAVNLAARLTDAARPAGTTIASAATVAGAAGGRRAVALPPLQVKGRTAAVSAYRVEAAEVTAISLE